MIRTSDKITILALPAGQELDMLVAEKLFGWRWWRWQPYSYGGASEMPVHATWYGSAADPIFVPPHRFFGPTVDWHDFPGWKPKPWDGKEELAIVGMRTDLPDYSTDIAAAWLLLEKIGYPSLIGNGWSDGKSKGKHSCHIEGQKQITCFADSVPLAICRACLLAVMDATAKLAEAKR